MIRKFTKKNNKILKEGEEKKQISIKIHIKNLKMIKVNSLKNILVYLECDDFMIDVFLLLV